jgi:flagellar FliJ protein
MKKFVWRLQRLLDIKTRQEELLRTELIALTEQVAAVRAEILMHKISIRSKLAQMRTIEAAERLEQQRHFMQFAHVLDARIKSLNEKMTQLEEQRKELIRRLMDVRKERKSLEKLREKARTEYQKESNQMEQKSTDETNSTAFARKLIMPQEHAALMEQSV